ncbi:LysR family transcriptional regulator [Streptomyces sp. NPDC053750]|uniref:LysR family transcriptional regulator n=1 Tax=Streptomyces sp. NPDC053750 TaxID=3365714 RepID=UPI0037D4F169
MPVHQRLCFPDMSMELRHLRCFLTIAEAGSITRAASRLHTSQPALSRTLRQLEEHLGVRLIDRSTHHLYLTSAGEAFRVRATAALAAVDAALDPGQLGTWPLRLGHAWSALGKHTTALLRRWQRAQPGIPLELLRIDDRTAGLAEGRVDAALLRGPINLAGTRSLLQAREPRIAAVPTSSPLADHVTVSLADLSEQTLALNTVSGTTSLDLWPAGSRPSDTLAVANTDDWLAAIAAGRAVGVTSAATAGVHPHPGVAYLSLIDAPSVPLLLVHSEPPSHPAVPQLADMIRDLVREHGHAPGTAEFGYGDE